MNKLLIANLKMNLNYEDIIEYKKVIENSDITNFVICPSNIYLHILSSNKYELCAQNGYHIDEGAVTGEVSFKQLKSMGVKYSLIGHSERRNIFNESNDDIRKKLKSCIENGITPILCVGENKDERESGNAEKIVDIEIKSIIQDLILSDLIIAYEPIWAIGTSLIPTSIDIMNMHSCIKEIVKDNTKNVKVIYGGSVNESNIKDICNIEGVDGVLIGDASNDPLNIIKMYNLVK